MYDGTRNFVELETGPTLQAHNCDWREGKSIIERNLYMLKTQTCCDTTILVGEQSEAFRAHSFILVPGSSIFAKILEENAIEKKVIRINGIKPEIFHIVLQ